MAVFMPDRTIAGLAAPSDSRLRGGSGETRPLAVPLTGLTGDFRSW